MPNEAKRKKVPASALVPSKKTPFKSLSDEQQQSIARRHANATRSAQEFWDMLSAQEQSNVLKILLLLSGGEKGHNLAANMHIPKEVLKIIFQYFNDDSARFQKEQNIEAKLSLIQSPISFFRTIGLLNSPTLPLLEYAIVANYDALNALLSELTPKNRDVLRQKGTIRDHNGYVFENLTVLQLLRKLEDVDVVITKNGQRIHVIKGMAEMVEAHIIRLFPEEAAQNQQGAVEQKQENSGIEIINQQRFELLSANEKVLFRQLEREPEKWKALHQAIGTIKIAENEEECLKALATFKTLFKPEEFLSDTEVFLSRKIALRVAIFEIRQANTEKEFDAAKRKYNTLVPSPDPIDAELLEDVIQLWKLTQVFKDPQKDAETCKLAVKAFQDYLKNPKRMNASPKELLLEAYHVFNHNFNALTAGDRYDKADLFCAQVIGYLQSLLAACDLQVFAFSLYDVVEGARDFVRNFEFRHQKGIFLLPVDVSSRSQLGVNYFASRWAHRGLRGGRLLAGVSRDGHFLENLCRAKHQHCQFYAMPKPTVQSGLCRAVSNSS